jgi:hypothetical protein
MEQAVNRTREPLWIALIVLLGLALRLTALWWGQSYFYFGQGDSLEAYSVAVDYARDEPRAQYLGQPNYNSHSKLPGPLWTIFCSMGLRLGGSVQGIIVASILLNSAVIFLIYLLAKGIVGSAGSLWAALLAATLPSPVFYSLGVYNPQVMPFLGACLALALWAVIRQERSRHSVWLGLLLLGMLQFHMAGIVLWPAVALILLLSPVRLNFGWLAAGFVAGALFYVPYLRGELANHWQNTRGMAAGHHALTWDGLKALTAPLNLLVNWVPQWSRSAAEYRDIGRACFGAFGILLVVNLVSAVVAGFLAVGVFQQLKAAGRGFWRAPRSAFARAPGLLFLAILLVVPLICALLIGQPFHARYALVLLAPLLVLAGAAVAQWLAAPRVGPFFTVALIVTTCANVWFMPAFYWRQGKAIEQGDLFIPSFHNMELVYQKLKTHAGPNRPVRVDDAAYLRSLPQQDEIHREANLIRTYVAVREKESGPHPEQADQPITYELCRAHEAIAGDTNVAYAAHGIALRRRR